MKQQVFKVINGAVKDPELTGGFNGTYGHFTGDDIINDEFVIFFTSEFFPYFDGFDLLVLISLQIQMVVSKVHFVVTPEMLIMVI